MPIRPTLLFLLLATAAAVIRHAELRADLQVNKCGMLTCLSSKPVCCSGMGQHTCVAKTPCPKGLEKADSVHYVPPVIKVFSFPTSPTEGETWLQTACKAAIVDAKGMGASDNSYVTLDKINEITHTQFKPGQSAFSVEFWHQEGPKPDSCTLYPSETSTTYGTPETRVKNNCELYNMRNSQLCPTDNPVRPLTEGNHIVWEARHSEDLKSKFLCPAASESEAADSLAHLQSLGVATYGGEAECKAMIVVVSTRKGKKGTNPRPQDTYGKNFLTITKGDKEMARLETEWWQGQEKIRGTKVYFEFVGGVFPVTAESRQEYMSIVNAIAEQSSTETLGHMKTRLQSKLSGLTVDIYDQAPFTKELTSIQTPANIKASTCICQGNYAIPASAIGLKHNQNPHWPKALELGGLMVTTLEGRHPDITLSKTDNAEMRAMFAIYFYNMYFFRQLNTLKDNKKDSWDQLPKAAPLDIMRSLSGEAKNMMLAEFAQ